MSNSLVVSNKTNKYVDDQKPLGGGESAAAGKGMEDERDLSSTDYQVWISY